MKRRFISSLALIVCTLFLVTVIRGTAHSQPTTGTKGVYNVKTYNAKGDGQTLDSPAINKAIDAAAAAGGGTVYFPAGTYLSGSIHLKSNIQLYIDQGATILASPNPGDFDPAEPNQWDQYQDYGHSHWHNSLIWGENLHDISITGPGRIDGRNLSRAVRRNDKVTENKTIALKQCRNVIIRDISIFKAGHFGILATGVDNWTVDNLKIDTNRDGINIDCCRNVRISNCSINSPWDDAIVMKSSYGLGSAIATENVTITNCMVSGGYVLGTLLDGTFQKYTPQDRIPHTGRIKCGTESNGGFKNITISNCVFDNCQGLALETVDGGLLEDVSVSNITMRDIVSMPIFLRLGSRMRGPEGTPVGQLRRVTISNIVVYNSASRAASTISGIPGHNIEDVQINNLQFFVQGGGTSEQAQIQVPEKENSYPEPTMFGTLPAYGFFIRHARGIEINNVSIHPMKPDSRPPFYLDDVRDVEFNNVKTPKESGVPTFNLHDTQAFQTHQVEGVPNTHLETADNKQL